MSETTPRPLTVLHVITGLELGGAERILVNSVRLSHARGISSHVVALKSGGQTRSALDEIGVPVDELNAASSYPDPLALRKLHAIIRAKQPDIVQAWMYHANLFASAAIAGSRLISRSRLVWGIYNSRLDLAHYDLRLRAVLKAGALLSRHPAAIVYNSDRAMADHSSINFRARQNTLIGNGVDCSRFRPSAEVRAATRRRLGIAPNAQVALVVARVDPQKDWDTVLKGVALVDGLVTLAVGTHTKNLPDQPGLIRNGPELSMHDIYPAADVFILPSAFGEGTSVAMNEAMSCGVPIIVTDVGDNGRFGAVGGRVIEPRSPTALAAAIKDLLGDHDLRMELGSRGRAMMHQIAGSEGSLGNLFTLWQNLTKAR